MCRDKMDGGTCRHCKSVPLAQVATFAQALEASVGGLLGLNCPSLLFS